MAENINKMNKEKELLSVKQASRYLFLSERTLQRLSQIGKIKGIKLGNQWKFYKEDIERYLQNGIDLDKKPIKDTDNFKERRTYPRINTNSNCRYSINLLPFREAHCKGIIKDLSAGGALVIYQEGERDKIKLNDPVNLDFNLALKDDITNIQVIGKIVRINNDELGIKFRSMDNLTESKITRYIG